MILFLDYDGVLHPDAVYEEKGRPVLRAEGELFMWSPYLEELLAPYPQVKIVLSTSWVKELRFSQAKSALLPSLQNRVIGATWHSAMARHPEASHRISPTWWDSATRYQQILRYVERASLSNWLAVDDHPEGWGESDMDKLIRTESATGLSSAPVRAYFAAKLQQFVTASQLCRSNRLTRQRPILQSRYNTDKSKCT